MAVIGYDPPSTHLTRYPASPRLLGPCDPGTLVHMRVASSLYPALRYRPARLVVLEHETLGAFPFVARQLREGAGNDARLDGEASVVEAYRAGDA